MNWTVPIFFNKYVNERKRSDFELDPIPQDIPHTSLMIHFEVCEERTLSGVRPRGVISSRSRGVRRAGASQTQERAPLPTYTTPPVQRTLV